MPVIFPYIPRTITVHLCAPDQAAENVTVSFPDYVKNVASSEIYPTWEPAAIRANVLAIVSFALNRVYTDSGDHAPGGPGRRSDGGAGYALPAGGV